MSAGERTLTWRPPASWGTGRPDLGLLAPHRRGPGDPTYRIEGPVDGGVHWRGLRTPEGPATLALRVTGDAVQASAWGAGADWALGSVPGLFGADDDPSGFEPPEGLLEHPGFRDALRRGGVPRLGRTGLVMEAMLPSILEQKVTGQEAFGGFREVVRRFGEQAPGPGAERRLWIQPDAATLSSIPSWEWLRMHVDPARSRAVVTAARVAASLERTVGLPATPEGRGEVERRLTSLPGIGEWTAAEVRQRAHGDADAVSFGDYHVCKDVGWGLTGRPWDDEEMRAYLAPCRPHRQRLVLLVYRAFGHRPRHGPRMAPRTHLPTRSWV